LTSGAAYLSALEQPQATTALIHAFLDRVEVAKDRRTTVHPSSVCPRKPNTAREGICRARVH